MEALDFNAAIGRAVTQASWDLARQREERAVVVAREFLPRPLRWAVDHPRVLRVLYRAHRRWRPRMVTYGPAFTEGEGGRMVVTEMVRFERDR